MGSATAASATGTSADGRRRWLLGALALALAAAAVLTLGAGAVPTSAADVVRALAGSPEVDAAHAGVIWAIRLPRAILGILVGAGLAVAGALLQALFRNPLADPGLIGVSGGAALAAASFLVLGESATWWLPATLQRLALPLAAFGGGLAAVVAVQRLARVGAQTSMAALLLAGIALGSLAGAAMGLLLFVASEAQLRAVTFWSLGSLGGATGETLVAAGPPLLLALALAPRLAHPLNLLLLGEDEAGHLGIDVERLKRRAVALAALAVGAGVAVTGIIGFVGLVVPHLVRLVVGPDHRSVIPGSALLGAALLLLADVGARTLAAPAEVPIGILTALLGAPFLLWLLRRTHAAREAA